MADGPLRELTRFEQCDLADGAELIKHLFPGMSGMQVELVPPKEGAKGSRIRICDNDGNGCAEICFGVNPESHAQDGLIHILETQKTPPVWKALQRWSDGKYRDATGIPVDETSGGGAQSEQPQSLVKK